MPIEGPLRELSIQDVLQMLDLAQKTGVLTVRSQRRMDEAVVHLVDGELVFASRRRSLRRLGQQLLREGKIGEDELRRALELQRSDPKQRLGAILVEMGTVDEGEVERQLRFQVEETIYDLLGWDEGYFRFEETDEAPSSPIRVRVESLLMEGARRLDEWTRLQKRVSSPEAVPLLAPTDGEQGLIDLRPEEWEVLAAIDGERDLRHIASELNRSAFDIAKIVYGLVSMSLVTVADRPAGGEDERLAPLLDELEQLLRAGESETVERRARGLQQDYPDRAEIPFLAGLALVAQNRLRAATEAFERAAALDPLYADAHYQLGLVGARTADWERAERAWRTYLRLNRAGDRSRYVRDALDAIAELNRILEVAPTE